MGLRGESGVSNTSLSDRRLTAVLLQTVPLLLMAIAILAASGSLRLLALSIPFSFGLGYMYLGRWRRYLLTLVLILVVLVLPFVWLVFTATTSSNPNGVEGVAILGAILLTVDGAIVVVVEVVQIIDVWHLASKQGHRHLPR